MRILIFGAGGFAREIQWLLESANNIFPVAFVDSNPNNYDTTLNGLPVISIEKALEKYDKKQPYVIALGDPKKREEISKLLDKFYPYKAIHKSVLYGPDVTLGKGTVICAGSILTTNIKIGIHVQINLNCTVGHDSILDDFVTLAPGVHVSGNVHLGKRVYVGTGATIINGSWTEPLVIGDDAIIGAGACVTKSLPGNMTYVGVPARPLNSGPK